MPTDLSSFHKSRKEWSRWKHAILKEYLKVMPAILQSREVIYYVDGFAGQGKYHEDNSDGSALLAAKHAKNLYYSGRKYILRCINVESDSETCQNLQESTRKYEAWVENLPGSFGDHVPTILARVGDQPALFFLDPIGLKGLEWNSLWSILQRRREQVTELLIGFDGQTALRLTGADANLHERFNLILGEVDSRYWRKYLANCGQLPQDRRDALTKACEDKLSSCFPFVARMPIRSADEAIKYSLLFATAQS